MSKEKLPLWVRKIRSEKDTFWKKIYPEYSEQEKLHFWADELLSTMRTQGETTGDEYSAFTKEWFDNMLRHEHLLPAFLVRIFRQLGNEINVALFYERVKRSPYKLAPAYPKLYGKAGTVPVLAVHEEKAAYKVKKASRKKKK